MKKRFLPFLMAVLVFGQFAIADNGGHYVPRTQGNATAESFMGSLRANQHTGLIDPAWMLQATQNQARGIAAEDLYWISMGPDNMGGQTTAIVYDNQSNVVYIGSKGGGVYKTYNLGVTWHQVGEQDLMVSSMVQDTDGTIYIGTGDGDAAATFTGLDQQNYENSFIGSGIWMLKDDAFTQIATTVPTLNEVTSWSFVNELALSGNKLIAATNGGLRYTTDKGATWTMLVEGKAEEVKVLSDGTIMASVDGMLYIGTTDEMICHSTTGNNPTLNEDGEIIAIPAAAGLLDIAFAPTNENVMYASCVNASGVHAGIYVSYDKGATWEVALPSVTTNILSNNLYGYFGGDNGTTLIGRGLINHGIVVDPNDEGRLYILGYYLWKLEKPETFGGYYLTEMLTGESMYMLDDYLHVGLHAMVFNPRNSNECYFGTDGGVYKATGSAGNFAFNYCNRNYVTTRMFNIAYSGKSTRVMAAGLDHGVVMIEGDENLNSMSHGDWINPGAILGLFNENYQAGPCAISNINPNTIFVTFKNGAFQRSETAGYDWVSTNFLENLTVSTSSFRMPILLYEDFEDELNPATVWFKNEDSLTIPAHTTVQLMSNNDFPFDYTLSQALQVGDSIEVHDPISSRLYVSFTGGVYVTRGGLEFAAAPTWYQLTNSNLGFAGEPLCMAISADGDYMFVGTKEGKLFRLSNLNTVLDDASGSLSDTTGAFQVTTTELVLPTDGQCVTSVAVDPQNANKIIVTLGNYGNSTYVLYSTDALAAEPTLVSKQANLPKMPVYSSVIEMETGQVILGTEHGIYTATNISSPDWVSDSHMLGDVPVMDLKQQLLQVDDQIEMLITENDTVYNIYPGVHNKGIIYAATYGHGVFRCENYKQESGIGVPDMPVAVETTVSLYPNPVHSNATISFDVNGQANVSYQVYDLMGRLVMNQNLGRYNEGSYEVNVNMSDLSSGSYILRLNQGSNSSCTKFVVY